MKTCVDCGATIDRHATRCVAHAHAHRAAITGKQTQYQYTQNARKAHPQQKKARQAVYYAVKVGKLAKSPCAVCGDVDVQAHHWRGYDKAHRLDVIWLCRECHRTADRKEGN
jgi:hypothetical protein